MECAVLFADVAGSTALYEVLGDERAFALVENCLQTMSACTTEVHGRVVKTIGDAVMSVFKDADDAAAAAAEMQFRVDKLGPAVGVRLGVRVGFHFGPVVERDNDVFGDTVNLASRLSGARRCRQDLGRESRVQGCRLPVTSGTSAKPVRACGRAQR